LYLRQNHASQYWLVIPASDCTDISGGICKNEECRLLRTGGYNDHVHILVDIHPSKSLSDFMRLIKGRSSRWINEEGVFPGFEAWQRGYAAFSVSYRDRDMIIDYIRKQEEHHRKLTFLEEYQRILNEAGYEIDERYLP